MRATGRALTHETSQLSVRIAASAIVLYVHLWVLEGALRKWVPGLGEAMYVARDLIIAAAIIALTILPNRRVRSLPVFWLFAVGIGVLSALQVVVGAVSLPVAVVGLRSYVAPLLAVYVYFCYAPPETLRRVTRVILWYVPVQLALGLGQVLSPRESWINREVSGDEAHFINDGIVRISGTFSAPSGLSTFVILAIAVSLGALLDKSAHLRRPQVVLILGMATVLTLISGARGTLLGVVIVGVAVLYGAFLREPSRSLRIWLGVAVAGGIALWGATAVAPAAIESFQTRFDDASRTEDTAARVLDQAVGFLTTPVSWIGNGIGANSQAGIALGSGEPWVEIDSVRWVAELGIAGLFLATARLVIAAALAILILTGARRRSWTEFSVLGAIVPVLAFGSVTQTPSSQAAVGVMTIILLAARDQRLGVIGDGERPVRVGNSRQRPRSHASVSATTEGIS